MPNKKPHKHLYPENDQDILAAKEHKHVDGKHSHPHPKEHKAYVRRNGSKF